MLTNKLLEQKLKEIPNVEFGYLFGSYSDGSFHDRSDVDIALFLDDYSFDEQLSVSFELSRVLQKDVDLVVLNSVKNLYLLDDILQKGILIKDSKIRVEYELKKHHQILDYKEFKKRIYAA